MASYGAAGDRFGQQLTKLADNTGLTRTADAAGNLGRQVAGAAESMARFVPALAGVTGAASIAGMAALANHWTTFTARLGLDAQRINTTADGLHALQGAARLAGSSAEALTDGMRTLGDNLVDAVGGRSPQTVAMLGSLGIAFRDASTGGARLATDVLPEIANKIAKLPTPALQARAAVALFGGAAENLLPFLRRGAAGITEYTTMARNYGVQNAEGVRSAQDLARAQTGLSLAMEGVGYTVAQRVAPVLVPMLTRLSDWIASHREEIGAFFRDVATRIDEWGRSGGPERLMTDLRQLGTGIKEVVDAMGGWRNAAIVLIAILNRSLIFGIVSTIAAVGRLTTALAVGLVQGFASAGTAAELFSARTMKLPVFRVLAASMAILDKMQEGIPVENLSPQQRRNLGLPEGKDAAPNTVPGSAAPVDTRNWLERNLPARLGGLPDPRGPQGGAATPGRATSNLTMPAAERMALAKSDYLEFRRMGDSHEVAVGRIANIDAESGFNMRNHNTNGEDSYGLGQWSVDRRKAFTQQFGHSMEAGTRLEQLQFLRSDPDAGARTAEQLNQRPGITSSEAAGNITRYSERPSNVEGDAMKRGALANGYDRTFRDLPVNAPAAMAPPVSAPPPLASTGQAGPNGRVDIRIDGSNLPPGLNMGMSTSGQAMAAGPRVEHAMFPYHGP